MNIKSILMLFAALSLSACASASDYKTAIDKFADATSQAQSALVASDKAVGSAITDERRTAALANPNGVYPYGENACSAAGKACVIGVEPKGGTQEPIEVPGIIPQHISAMAYVQKYSASLQDIARADSSADVTKALNQINQTGGKWAAELHAPQLTPALALVTNVSSWLFTQYQEQAKLEALRDATQAMDKIIADAATKFSTTASFLHEDQITRLEKAVDAAGDRFRQKPSDATLTAYLTVAHQLDAALQGNPTEVFRALADAHHQLTLALTSEKPDFTQAMIQMNRFVDAAQSLYSYVQAYDVAASAAAKKKPSK